MQKKALKMNLAVVRRAEEHASNSATVSVTHAAEKIARCLAPFALPAVKRPPYHLSRPETDQFTAETVSRLDGPTATDKLSIDRV